MTGKNWSIIDGKRVVISNKQPMPDNAVQISGSGELTPQQQQGVEIFRREGFDVSVEFENVQKGD